MKVKAPKRSPYSNFWTALADNDSTGPYDSYCKHHGDNMLEQLAMNIQQDALRTKCRLMTHNHKTFLGMNEAIWMDEKRFWKLSDKLRENRQTTSDFANVLKGGSAGMSIKSITSYKQLIVWIRRAGSVANGWPLNRLLIIEISSSGWFWLISLR